MFKLVQVVQHAPRPVAVENSFQTFVVTMPEELMPVLQRRIINVLLKRYYGEQELPDMLIQELVDLDTFINQYTDEDEHMLTIDGRHLSLLKRFLTAERMHLGRSRAPITPLKNTLYWELVSDLLMSTIRPTQVVELSFIR